MTRQSPYLQMKRPGYTLVELLAAVAVLAVVMVLVAQTSYWSLRERQRNRETQAALELAENVLESARGRPWEELTSEWAGKQKISAPWTDFLPEGKLQVQVEAEKSVPRTRRVTVTVRWHGGLSLPPREVQLVSLFTARTPVKGGKP